MIMDFALNHAYLIPLLPALAFAVILAFTRLNKKTSAFIAISAMSVSFLLALAIAFGVVNEHIVMTTPFIQRALWVTIGGIPLSLLVEIYSIGYMEHDKGAGRFFAFLSLFSASMLGLVISVSFVQMYAFWELVGLCSYLLIGFYYYKDSAREAAKKAFITTRIGDFGMLLGILLVQLTFGTVDFVELRQLVPSYVWTSGTSFLTIIGLLLFIGPIGKSGQFPLHVWLPDAMEGPTPVSALIHAATMVVAGVYLVGRAYFLFSELPIVMDVIAWIGGFTAIFAASIAITQRPFKKILAYSTISQLGYMMLALGVGSLTASMFHLMTHAFFKALLFLCAGAVIEAMNEEADIFKMGGLRHRMPTTFACMTIGVLAISGIPPFAGFFSKDAILAAAAEVSTPLYIMATVTAFMTAFYMARLLFVAFLGELRDDCPAHETNDYMRYPLIVLAVLATVSGVAGHFLGFGEWVRFGPFREEEIDPMIAGVSIVLTLVAYYLAYEIYVAKRWSSYELSRRLGLIYTLSYNKFYVDEFYTLVRNVFIDGLAAVCYWLDVNVVQRALDAMAHFMGLLSEALSYIQNGEVQRYVAVFYCGVIALVAYGIFWAVRVIDAVGGAF